MYVKNLLLEMQEAEQRYDEINQIIKIIENEEDKE